jgi:hypothetical protein
MNGWPHVLKSIEIAKSSNYKIVAAAVLKQCESKCRNACKTIVRHRHSGIRISPVASNKLVQHCPDLNKSNEEEGKLFATPTDIPNRGKNEGDKGETGETPGHTHLYLNTKTYF